jgi:hypothetical protein
MGMTEQWSLTNLNTTFGKMDGRALEYFWGWDTSGGKSGKIGIKQFICDKIQSVQPTSFPFNPRYAVEF